MVHLSGKRKKSLMQRLQPRAKKRGAVRKTLAPMIAVLGLLTLSTGFIGTPAQAEGGDKVFVCKYVGQPGVDERLQTGDNPISVSVNSIPNYQGVGSYFADQHGRSFVLAVDNTPPGPAGDPGVGACPAPEGPPHDECPNLPGNQPAGTDCNPPPHDECPNLPGNQPAGTDCNPPPHDECPNLTGSVKTTLVDGSVVNGNIYKDKSDVYISGSQLGDVTTVYIRVTDPSGSTVLSETKQVSVTGGSFGPVQLPAFSDSPNNGDEYKVWVSSSPDFEQKCTKFDNFKVKGEDPELVVTVIPNQGSCEVRRPEAQVTTSFASSIGYRLVGGETVFVHSEVAAGTYVVSLPLVAEGDSVSYEIIVTPLDDSADAIVKGPYTFSVPENCSEEPPCVDFQDEDPAADCYVEREPDERVEPGTRQGCRLGGVETTTAVYTTTYSFDEDTQQWESKETATSSQTFVPYTAGELKALGCVKQPPPDNHTPQNPPGLTGAPDTGLGEPSSPSRGWLVVLIGLFGIGGLVLSGRRAGVRP